MVFGDLGQQPPSFFSPDLGNTLPQALNSEIKANLLPPPVLSSRKQAGVKMRAGAAGRYGLSAKGSYSCILPVEGLCFSFVQALLV